jgi:IS5 family transposase
MSTPDFFRSRLDAMVGRLLDVARRKIALEARRAGVALKQTYEKEGRHLRRRAGGYAHARQFRRLRRVLKRQRTILGTAATRCARQARCAGCCIAPQA